ncbi:hypothetical protein LTS18_004516 [Coniosporium uncinatum]|uniref:Uncharacterized protein n=1 Tax=Coniosporium uncinatum TaxID=93489 RepID=A0ACC3D5P6_9PEZI|nr:hypothetical protein LTS18_004516 [Coniosporium uncinatum]
MEPVEQLLQSLDAPFEQGSSSTTASHKRPRASDFFTMAAAPTVDHAPPAPSPSTTRAKTQTLNNHHDDETDDDNNNEDHDSKSVAAAAADAVAVVPFSSMPDRPEEPVHHVIKQGLTTISIDDFLAANAAVLEALPSRSASAPTSLASTSASASASALASTSTFKPLKRLTAASPAAAATAGSVPAVVAKTYTSDHIIRLNQLCQARGLVPPAYEFEEVLPQRFGARLRFGMGEGEEVVSLQEGEKDGEDGQEEGGEGKGEKRRLLLFASKKDAKAAVAEKGLKMLLAGMAGGGGSALSAGVSGAVRQEAAEMEKENWVGLLLEYTNAAGVPAPLYGEFALGQRFGCTVSVDTANMGEGVDEDVNMGSRQEQAQTTTKRFGSKETLHSSKKAAQRAAAREAVLWLRAKGEMPDSGPPKKKKQKVTGRAITALPSQQEADAKKEKSYGQRVNELCVELGLGMPEYRFSADARAAGFLSGGAWFLQSPLVPSPVGEVRNVVGRKKAREECAKGLVRFLEELRAERLRTIGD